MVLITIVENVQGREIDFEAIKKLDIVVDINTTLYVNRMMLIEGTNIQSLPKKKKNHLLLTNIFLNRMSGGIT